MTGFVPHERVPSICATADLLVLPSFYEEVHALYLRLASAASAGRLRRERAADALAPTSPSVARRRRSG